MQRRRFILALALAGFAVTGCAPPHRRRRPPPAQVAPPPAPRHGHRRTHRGVDLVYDSDLGVYVVPGRRDFYYHSGWYWRRYRDGWQISGKLSGPWHPHTHQFRDPPPGLRKRY